MKKEEKNINELHELTRMKKRRKKYQRITRMNTNEKKKKNHQRITRMNTNEKRKKYQRISSTLTDSIQRIILKVLPGKLNELNELNRLKELFFSLFPGSLFNENGNGNISLYKI